MTDVYISCARADAGLMVPVVEAIQAEGWSVWFEPDTTPARREHAIDAELGAAGAVVILWSANSRDSEFVRTEAATGLYRNKLIQITMKGGIPPRPFDQLEAIDLGGWDGSTESATWQRILECIRLFAGSPGANRPQVVRNSAAGFGSEAASRPVARPSSAASPEPTPLHDVLHETHGPSSTTAPAETHVFDAPVDDAPSIASRADQALGVASPEAPDATVTPDSSPSPIAAAISEMERTLSSAARSSENARDREPAREVAAEPIQFVRSNHDEIPPVDRDDRDWLGREIGSSTDDDVFVQPSRSGTGPAMRGPRRTSGVAPVAIVGVLAVLGGGLWFVDPMGWRDGGEKSAFAASPGAGETVVAEGPAFPVVEGPLRDDPVAREVWDGVDRADPEALRAFIFAHADTSSAETARALLKVLDAQAWADAVTEDMEAGYDQYLATFPPPTGEMAGAARARLVSLGAERKQAITTIQVQLRELNIYRGVATGAADSVSQQAANRFASREDESAPVLAEAAPRDLRAFGDSVLAAVRAEADTGAGDTQVAALAVTNVAPEPAPEPANSPAPAQPVVAETEQPAAVAAEVPAERADAALASETAGADALAFESLQLTAWERASEAGTVEAYGAFVRDYPASPNVFAARAAIEQLSRPPAYGLDWLSADTRVAVEAARAAKDTANARAAAARTRAAAADEVANSARSGLADARTVVAPDGDIYETQVANSQPNGLGVRTAGDAQSSGDRYRGELRDGLGQGLGVYEYGENPNNQVAQARRYEGEHANDVARGYGVTQWRNGNRFEGQDNGEQERGVMVFANGQRYEGQMVNGSRQGFGVFWSADGDVMLAGRWENGDLVEPMTPPPRPEYAALTADASAPAVDTP